MVSITFSLPIKTVSMLNSENPSKVIQELVNNHLDEIPAIVEKVNKEIQEKNNSRAEIETLLEQTKEGKI